MQLDTLPETEAELLRSLRSTSLPKLRDRASALHHTAGWPLRAIGEPLNAPRSTVHSWVIRSVPPHNAHDDPPLPTRSHTTQPRPRPITATPLREKTLTPEVPLDKKTHISQLAPLARRCRAGTTSTSEYRRARDELDTLVTSLYQQGVPISKLAAAAGVTYRAMAVRLQEATNR